MDRRTAWLLTGVLALCCVALALAAVYPFATAAPHAENPVDERFTVPEATEYRTEGAIVVDGTTALEFEGAVASGGGRYQVVDEGGVRTERYQASPDSPVYSRIVVEGGSADRRRDHITADTDRELLRETRTDGTVAFIVKGEPGETAEAISGTASVVVRSLYVVGYDRNAGDPREPNVYVPENGWYEGAEAYRVTGATGEVRTAADTTAVRSVAVTWEQTRPAGTYAESVLARLTSDAPRTYNLSFRFEAGETTVNRPAWVTDYVEAGRQRDRSG